MTLIPFLRKRSESRRRRPRAVPQVERLEKRELLAGVALHAHSGFVATEFAPGSQPGPKASHIFDVTRTADAGRGSLRWAMEQANAMPGGNVIRFRLDEGAGNRFVDVDGHLRSGDPDPDAFVIQPLTPLPALNDPTGGTIIDGHTQTAFGGDRNPTGPEVVLDGSRIQVDAASGISIAIGAHENEIRGLNLQGFSGDGVTIVRSNKNIIAGNYIGTDATGTEARPNGTTASRSSGGILISAGARKNLIGRDKKGPVEDGNLIAGNHRQGIRIQQGASSDRTKKNVVRGNIIGRDDAMAPDLGNENWGVLLVGGNHKKGVQKNVIEHNLIAGNARGDVVAVGFAEGRNKVRNNSDTPEQVAGVQDGLTYAVAQGFAEEFFDPSTGLPTADFSWRMEERTGPDFHYPEGSEGPGGDIPNKREYVNPSQGYVVELDGSTSRAGLGHSITDYKWTIRGRDNGVARIVYGVKPEVSLPEGPYTVTLEVSNSDGQSQTAEGEIVVDNILIVSMGDSYASGEGNPHATIIHGIWAYGADDDAMNRNQAAHRSIFSGPAQAAWALEKSDPYTSVTFVSVAGTGAETKHLFESAQEPDVEGFFDSDTILPPQIDQLEELTHIRGDEYRKIDRLFLSSGGNDIGFGSVVRDLLQGELPKAEVERKLYGVPGDARYPGIQQSYERLAEKLDDSNLEVADSDIFVTGYPDPTSDESADGTPDKIMDDVLDGIFWVLLDGEIDSSEIRWARDIVITPLNIEVGKAARANGWRFVPMQDALWGHGYAAEDNWIVTWDESVDRQGRDGGLLETKGVMHPNEKGHAAMAVRMMRSAFGPDFRYVVDAAPHVTATTNRIQVNLPPLRGQSWQPQTMAVTFSEAMNPDTVTLDDIEIRGPDGTVAEVLSVRPESKFYLPGVSSDSSSGVSRFFVTFRPTAYGLHSITVGSEVFDTTGNGLDQNRDGIQRLRRGAESVEAYRGVVSIDAPKFALPSTPVVQRDENGDIIGSIQQYAESPVQIPFSVATLNAQFRPTNLTEFVPKSVVGLGTILSKLIPYADEIAGSKPLPIPTEAYKDKVPETHADSTERVGMVLSEYSKFDIVALQEVFDRDQVRQIAAGAAQLGFHHLRGPGQPCAGWWVFKTCFGWDSGLSLMVGTDLSSQSDFHHHSEDFSNAGNAFDLESIANKGFTLDTVQLDASDPNHFVYVVNTHLHAESSSVRFSQINQMANYVDSHTDGRHPVIFMGDFNVSNTFRTPGSEYDHLISTLRAYDPFQDYEDQGAAIFDSSDLNRNAYKRFNDRKSPEQLENDYEPHRIDHILIRQGSEYGIQVDALRLEDGTHGNSGNLETEWFQKWERDHADMFGPDKLVAYPSDHFGLSADLVLVQGAVAPAVTHSTDTFYAIMQSAYDAPWTPLTIDLEFDKDVSVASVRDGVQLLSPSGEQMVDIVVRPVFDDPLDGLSYEMPGGMGDVFTPTGPTSGPFHAPLPGGEQKACLDPCLPQPAPEPQPDRELEGLLRRRGGQFTDKYQIIFQPDDFEYYQLKVGPAIFDRYGHEMDQNGDGRRGTVEDEYVSNVAVYNPNWRVKDIAAGDVDDDGEDEVFTAFYDRQGNTWILRTDDNESVVSQVYHATGGEWTVQAMAVGDSDGDDGAELYVAFERDNGMAYIYRSESGRGIGSHIYASSTPGSWTVMDIALGDTDGDGRDELYSGFEARNGEARIYRSNSGLGIGNRIYTSASPGIWTVQSLEVGDADDNGRDELYSAFDHHTGEDRIYRSTSGTSIGGRIYRSPDVYWDVEAMSIGDINGDGRNEFFTALSHATYGSVMYRSNTGATLGSQIYETHTNETWGVLAMTLADVDGDDNDEMLTGFAAFDQSDRDALFRSENGYLDPSWLWHYHPPTGMQPPVAAFF